MLIMIITNYSHFLRGKGFLEGVLCTYYHATYSNIPLNPFGQPKNDETQCRYFYKYQWINKYMYICFFFVIIAFKNKCDYMILLPSRRGFASNAPSIQMTAYTWCSLNIVVFFPEFSKVCHFSLASTRLLLVVQKRPANRSDCTLALRWELCRSHTAAM